MAARNASRSASASFVLRRHTARTPSISFNSARSASRSFSASASSTAHFSYLRERHSASFSQVFAAPFAPRRVRLWLRRPALARRGLTTQCRAAAGHEAHQPRRAKGRSDAPPIHTSAQHPAAPRRVRREPRHALRATHPARRQRCAASAGILLPSCRWCRQIRSRLALQCGAGNVAEIAEVVSVAGDFLQRFPEAFRLLSRLRKLVAKTHCG